MEKAEHLDRYRAEIASLHKELLPYDRQLPRNMDTARDRLREVREEMERVTSAIREKMVTD